MLTEETGNFSVWIRIQFCDFLFSLLLLTNLALMSAMAARHWWEDELVTHSQFAEPKKRDVVERITNF